MAVPVIASSASYHDTSNATSRTIPKPSGISIGDWMLLFVNIDAGATINTPSGFTLVNEFDVPSTTSPMKQCIFKRLSDASDLIASTYTITTSSENSTGIIIRLTGADATDPIDVISYSAGELGTNAYVRYPLAYSIYDDSLVLRLSSLDGGSTTITTPPSGPSLVVAEAGGASGCSMQLYQQDQATAGYAAGLRGVCSSTSAVYIGMTIIVRSTTTPAAYPAQPVIRSCNIIIPTGADAVTYPRPYGVASGDLMVMVQGTDVSTFTPDSDFTSIQSNTAGAPDIRHQAYYRVAGGSETATYDGMSSTSAAKIGALLHIIRADTSAPINTSSANTGTSANPSASTITPSVDNCLLLFTFAADDDDGGGDNNYPSGYTGLFNIATTEGADSTMGMAFNTQTTAGATGAVTATAALGASEEWCAFNIAIKPGAVAGGTSVVVTEEADTMSGSAAVRVTSASAASETDDTLSSTSRVRLTAALSATETDDTLSASVKKVSTGSLARTEDDDTLAATAAHRPTVSLAKAEDEDTLVSSALVRATSSLAKAEDDDTLAASTKVLARTSLAKAEDEDTLAASATVTAVRVASLAATEEDDALAAAATGTATRAVSLAKAEDEDTLSSATAVKLTGSLARAEDNDTLNSPAKVKVNIKRMADAGKDDAEANDTLSATAKVRVTVGLATIATSVLTPYEYGPWFTSEAYVPFYTYGQWESESKASTIDDSFGAINIFPGDGDYTDKAFYPNMSPGFGTITNDATDIQITFGIRLRPTDSNVPGKIVFWLGWQNGGGGSELEVSDPIGLEIDVDNSEAHSLYVTVNWDDINTTLVPEDLEQFDFGMWVAAQTNGYADQILEVDAAWIESITWNELAFTPGTPKVEDNDTLSASAKVLARTSLAKAEDEDTLAATVARRPTVSLAKAEDDDVLTSSALVKVASSLAKAEDDDTLAAVTTLSTARVTSLAKAEDEDTLSSTTFVRVSASLVITEADDALAAVLKTPATAASAMAEADDALSAAARVRVTVALAAAELDDALSTSASVHNNLVLVRTEEEDSLSSLSEGIPSVAYWLMWDDLFSYTGR